MFERILAWYRKTHNIQYVILRYFNASGAAYNIGEKHEPETHLIPLVIQAALGQIDYIRIFGINYDTKDGTCVRDYIHVLDLAEAHFKALNHITTTNNSDFFNLGSANGTTVKEIIELVEKISKKNISSN